MSADEPTNGQIMAVLLRQTDALAAVAEVQRLHSEKFDAIDRRFDAVDLRFDILEGRFDHLEGRVDQLEVRFDRLEVKVDHLEVKVDRLGERVDLMAEDVAGIKVNQVFFDQHVADFTEWAKQHKGDPNAHDIAA
jgi:predicted nuclease with TOPRIM domain